MRFPALAAETETRPAVAPPAAALAAEPLAPQGTRILIVDDNKDLAAPARALSSDTSVTT